MSAQQLNTRVPTTDANNPLRQPLIPFPTSTPAGQTPASANPCKRPGRDSTPALGRAARPRAGQPVPSHSEVSRPCRTRRTNEHAGKRSNKKQEPERQRRSSFLQRRQKTSRWRELLRGEGSKYSQCRRLDHQASSHCDVMPTWRITRALVLGSKTATHPSTYEPTESHSICSQWPWRWTTSTVSPCRGRKCQTENPVNTRSMIVRAMIRTPDERVHSSNTARRHHHHHQQHNQQQQQQNQQHRRQHLHQHQQHEPTPSGSSSNTNPTTTTTATTATRPQTPPPPAKGLRNRHLHEPAEQLCPVAWA